MMEMVMCCTSISMRRARTGGVPVGSFFFVLLLHFCCTVVWAASGVEKSALLDFKSAITIDPNGFLSSWTNSNAADPCRDFTGVTCNESGDVEKLLVHSAELSGTLSPSLASLPKIQIISLFNNRISGSIPPRIAGIATLFKLNVSRNAFSGRIPSALGGIFSLRLLDLSWNNFSGAIPSELFNFCSRTRFVSLSHNTLSGPIPTNFSRCLNLEGIDFSFNNLTGLFPSQICDQPRMTYVSLRRNTMSKNILEMFENGDDLPNLASVVVLRGEIEKSKTTRTSPVSKAVYTFLRDGISQSFNFPGWNKARIVCQRNHLKRLLTSKPELSECLTVKELFCIADAAFPSPGTKLYTKLKDSEEGDDDEDAESSQSE